MTIMGKIEKGIICLFCALLGGCSTASQEPPPPLSKMMKVLSTTAMIGDLVAKVGGERVQGASSSWGRSIPIVMSL